MPIPENKRNTNGFTQNPQNINKKGRPLKIYTILKESGYSKDDVRVVFSELPMYSMQELKDVIKKKKVPVLVLIVAKAIESAIKNSDYKQVKEILEHIIGKPKQELDQNINQKNIIDFDSLTTEELINRANAIKELTDE